MASDPKINKTVRRPHPATVPPANGRSPLMEAPTEVRLRTIEMAAEGLWMMIQENNHFRDEFGARPFRRWYPTNTRSMANICRKFRQEAIPIIAQTVTLDLLPVVTSRFRTHSSTFDIAHIGEDTLKTLIPHGGLFWRWITRNVRHIEFGSEAEARLSELTTTSTQGIFGLLECLRDIRLITLYDLLMYMTCVCTMTPGGTTILHWTCWI
jgi:hypothetical protein